MLSLRQIILLSCTISLMLASPSRTHPTGNTAHPNSPSAPAAPNTLLGRQYQLNKRSPDPLIFMDPMLEKALGSAKMSEKEHNTARRPAAQPAQPPQPPQPPRAPQPAEQPQAESPQPTTRTATMPPENPTTTSNIAPRRLLPYPQYLAARAYANAAHYSAKDPDAPTPPSPPVVTDAFIANRTSENLDAVDASQSRGKGWASAAKNKAPPSSNGLPLLGGLGGGLPVDALGGGGGGGGGLPGTDSLGGGLPIDALGL